MNRKNPKNAVPEPEKNLEITVFTSLLLVSAGLLARKKHVSRQSSNSGRREGTFKSSCGIQAPDRREVRHAILHHIARWEGCPSVSLRGMAADRGETGQALQFQSGEEKVFKPYQLSRPGSGDRRAGAGADTGAAARHGQDPGRSGCDREFDVPRSAEHRGIQAGNRTEPVHVRR